MANTTTTTTPTSYNNDGSSPFDVITTYFGRKVVIACGRTDDKNYQQHGEQQQQQQYHHHSEETPLLPQFGTYYSDMTVDHAYDGYNTNNNINDDDDDDTEMNNNKNKNNDGDVHENVFVVATQKRRCGDRPKRRTFHPSPWAVVITILGIMTIIGSSWIVNITSTIDRQRSSGSNRNILLDGSSSSSESDGGSINNNSNNNNHIGVWSTLFSVIPFRGKTNQQRRQPQQKQLRQQQQQIQQGRKKNFSKIVVVVVNDQSDDRNGRRHRRRDDDDDEYSNEGDDEDDDDDDEDDNKNLGGTSKVVRTGNNSNGKKDESQSKQEQQHQQQQQQYSNNSQSTTKKNDDGEECEPKDWKCWRDKYNKSVTDTGTDGGGSSSSSSSSKNQLKDTNKKVENDDGRDQNMVKKGQEEKTTPKTKQEEEQQKKNYNGKQSSSVSSSSNMIPSSSIGSGNNRTKEEEKVMTTKKKVSTPKQDKSIEDEGKPATKQKGSWTSQQEKESKPDDDEEEGREQQPQKTNPNQTKSTDNSEDEEDGTSVTNSGSDCAPNDWKCWANKYKTKSEGNSGTDCAPNNSKCWAKKYQTKSEGGSNDLVEGSNVSVGNESDDGDDDESGDVPTDRGVSSDGSSKDGDNGLDSNDDGDETSVTPVVGIDNAGRNTANNTRDMDDEEDIDSTTEDETSTYDDGEASGPTTDPPCSPPDDWKCWVKQVNTTVPTSSSGTECAPTDWMCLVKQSKANGISTVTAKFNVDDGDSSTNAIIPGSTTTAEEQGEMESPAPSSNEMVHQPEIGITWQDRKDEEKMKKVKTNDAKHSKSATVEETACDDGKYSKRTLKLAYELPFAALFRDTKGQNMFEASSVTVVDGMAYAVCDSSWSVSMFDPHLLPFDEHNIQIGDPNRQGDDSGYEAIFYDDSSFYIVRESIIANDASGTYHAKIEQLSLHPNEGTYDVVSVCPSEFEFEGSSKGFEGAIPIHDLDGNLVVLGLCEGNYCSESEALRGKRGNGRIVAMKLKNLSDGSCQWSTIRVINIPPSAYFEDYSAIDMTKDGRVVIGSQEESKVWIGFLDGMDDNGRWNIDAMEFRPSVGKLYDFPKNDNCQTVYCNIEGVHWLNDDTLLTVSDKMKGKSKQPYQCFGKDQSAHVFVIP